MLIVAGSLFVFLLYVLLNSFQAEYNIYMRNIANITNGNLWSLFTVISEYSSEVGLILRFAGACLFLVLTIIIMKKDELRLNILRKALLLESAFYIFNIPFDIDLISRPLSVASAARVHIVYYETAVSYILQLLLISTTLLLLYIKTRSPTVSRVVLLRFGALAITAYSFALWVKHFFFNLYALPISLSNPVLIVSLLNSTLTILIGSIIILTTLRPVIACKTTTFNHKAFGAGLSLIGLYFVIYVILSTLNATILAFLPLTELWAISMLAVGVSFLMSKKG